MPREPRISAARPLPSLDKIFAVLGDASRLEIALLLLDGQPRTAGEIAESVALPASTCSYHLTKLLDAGITVCRTEGQRRLPVLRREELDADFPGLITLLSSRRNRAA